MQHSVASFILPGGFLSAALLYVGLLVLPLAYEHSDLQEKLKHRPELLAQIEDMDKRITGIRQLLNQNSDNGRWILQSARSDECLYKAQAEVVHLMQIYDMNLDTMENKVVHLLEAEASWHKTPVFFRLTGTWQAYLRFKRALAVYPCPVQIVNEKVSAGTQANLISVELSLLLLTLSDVEGG